MKSFLVASMFVALTVLVSFQQGASAADEVVSNENFAGPFVGIYTGVVQGKDTEQEYYNGAVWPHSQTAGSSGAILGLAAGYNFILGENVLFGFEADAEIRNQDGEGLHIGLSSYPFKDKMKSSASLRMKLGYIFNNKKTLGFLTGGLTTLKWKATQTDSSSSSSVTGTKWSPGTTVGGGLEHFMSSNVALKISYRYSDYKYRHFNTGSLWTGFVERKDYDEHSVRLGLNYYF
jgi:opacity protein-like surface antigen